MVNFKNVISDRREIIGILIATIGFLLLLGLLSYDPLDVKIYTNDYLIADEDGIVIIPHQIINKIINKAKEDLNSENKMREAILDGTDPKEAYLKYGKF